MSKKIYSNNKQKLKLDFSDYIKNFEEFEENNIEHNPIGEKIYNPKKGMNYFSKKNRKSEFINKKYIVQYNTHTYKDDKYNNKNLPTTKEINIINSIKKPNANCEINKNKAYPSNIQHYYPIDIYSKIDNYTFSYGKLDGDKLPTNQERYLSKYPEEEKDLKYIPNTITNLNTNKKSMACVILANQTLYRDVNSDINRDKENIHLINNYTTTQKDMSNKYKVKKQYDSNMSELDGKNNAGQVSNDFYSDSMGVFPREDNGISINKKFNMNMYNQAKNNNDGEINIIGSLSFEKFIKKSHSLSSLIAPTKFNEKIGTDSNIKKDKRIQNQKQIHSQIKPHIKNYDDRLYKEHTNNKGKFDLNLDRKHIQEKEKIKHNQRKNIEERKNSKRNTHDNSVFNRLTGNAQFLKKEKELKLLDDLYNKNPCSFEPEINKISKLQNRNVNDLYNWMNRKEEKRLKIEINMNKNFITKILPNSEEILKDLNPLYLEKKVEDRLIEKGNM